MRKGKRKYRQRSSKEFYARTRYSGVGTGPKWSLPLNKRQAAEGEENSRHMLRFERLTFYGVWVRLRL